MQKKVKITSTGTAFFNAVKLSLFVFGLIFMPIWSTAQTLCPESSPPNFEPEHEPRTLCQKYSPPLKFPNRFGTANTHFASQIIWNLNNGNDIFTGDIDLVGELIIDQDFTLLNCKVRIWPNVRIRVLADITFTLDGSKLFCCEDMWQGIDLDGRSNVVSKNITEIEDAMVAMESPCTATLSIQNTVFNRNIVGIRLGYDGPVPFDPCPTFPIFTKFAGNTFQCNAPLNGTANGVSFVGVQVYKTNASIGALTSTLNTFRNIQFGIRFESQFWGTSAVNRCRFEAVLNDGIFMAQGNLRVERCQFLNNGFRGVNVLETRGLVAQHNNFDCNDDVAAQTNGDNIYRHIHAAGFALNAAVDINHNFFGGNFSDSEKSEHLRGIELVGGTTMGGGTNIQIEWNHFDFLVVQVTHIESYEIFLNGEFPSSSSTNIEFNEFFLDQPSGNTGDNYLYGIFLNNGHKNNVELYSNTFDSDAWGLFSAPATDYGITMIGSMGNGNVISGNIFEENPNTAYSNNFFTGIGTRDFTSAVFCANNLRESAYPMYFQGTSMGTQYFANMHTGGGTSLVVQDGFIGQQGVFGGEHHGNKWYDKWINIIPTLHAFHYPPENAPDSRIWAHTLQSQRNPFGQSGYVFFSEYHPADIDPDQMDEWFKQDSIGYPEPGDCIDHIIISTETDKAVAGGTIATTSLSPAHIWTGKRYLYAKLMQNPGLQGDYIEFGPFIANESQGSVGQLFAVEQKIAEGLSLSANLETELEQIKAGESAAMLALQQADSILDVSANINTLNSAAAMKASSLSLIRILDSLYEIKYSAYKAYLLSKLQEALNLNDQVVALNNFENYEKTVNDIAIRRILFQNDGLTAAQVAVLNDIAAQCPKFGGHGVYRARGQLTGCDQSNWSDNYVNCHPAAALIQEQVLDNGFIGRSAKRQLSGQILAYPNPATDGVFIRLPMDSGGEIALSDMMGKVWKEAYFTTEDEKRFIDLSGISPGIYTCTVTTLKGERQALKLFIIKQ